MPERCDTTDRKACGLADKVGIGPSKFFPDQLRHLIFTDTIVATRYDNHCLATLASAKDNRFSDLGNCATNRGGSLRTGARWLLKFEDIGLDAGVDEELLNA